MKDFNDRLQSAIISRRFEGPSGYTLALVASALSYGLALLLNGLLAGGVLLLFVPAVLVAALFAGTGPALFAAFLSLGGGAYLGDAPAPLLIFGAVALAMAWCGGILHRDRRTITETETALAGARGASEVDPRHRAGRHRGHRHQGYDRLVQCRGGAAVRLCRA